MKQDEGKIEALLRLEHSKACFYCARDRVWCMATVGLIGLSYGEVSPRMAAALIFFGLVNYTVHGWAYELAKKGLKRWR